MLALGFLTFRQSSAIERVSTPIILEYADTMKSNAGIREVIGHVRFKHGNKTILAEHGLYNPLTGRVTLTKSVKLIEPGRVTKTDRAILNERTGNFEALGNVDILAGDSLRIRCNRAYYFEQDSLIQLYENVVINSMRDGVQVTGSKGEWQQGSDVLLVRGSTVYMYPDASADPPDTLFIRSNQISFGRVDRSAMFTGAVRLLKSGLRSKSDTLFHQPDSNFSFLSGSPTIWQDEDELSGDFIELYYTGNKLQKIIVLKNAQVLSPSQPEDPRRHRLSGDSLSISTVNDSLKVIHVNGNAQGYYHLWNEDKSYQGVNLSAADIIEITVVKDETKDILLLGDVSGTFYPPDMAPDMDKIRIFKANKLDDSEFK